MTIQTAEARNKAIGKALKGQTQSFPSALDNLITRLELADLLRLTPRSLDRWVWQRKGPRRFKIGNKSYYDTQTLKPGLNGRKLRALASQHDALRYGGGQETLRPHRQPPTAIPVLNP